MSILSPMGSGSAGHAPDENDQPATSIASPEVAALYFRRLRVFNLGVIGSVLILFAAAIPVFFVSNTFWRIAGVCLVFVFSVSIRIITGSFFRCPVCNYEFLTSSYFTEPKWHVCPNCHTQFTPERRLRWPAF